MRLPTVKDSRGMNSQTLFFVALAATTLLVRFVAGMFLGLAPVSPTEFASSFMMIMTPWVAREGIEKLGSK